MARGVDGGRDVVVCVAVGGVAVGGGAVEVTSKVVLVVVVVGGRLLVVVVVASVVDEGAVVEASMLDDVASRATADELQPAIARHASTGTSRLPTKPCCRMSAIS